MPDEEMKRQAALDLLKALGAKVLIFAETTDVHHDMPQSKRPVVKAGQWPELGRRLTEVADRTLAKACALSSITTWEPWCSRRPTFTP
jgi:inosose dehydratase